MGSEITGCGSLQGTVQGRRAHKCKLLTQNLNLACACSAYPRAAAAFRATRSGAWCPSRPAPPGRTATANLGEDDVRKRCWEGACKRAQARSQADPACHAAQVLQTACRATALCTTLLTKAHLGQQLLEGVGDEHAAHVQLHGRLLGVVVVVQVCKGIGSIGNRLIESTAW